MKKLFFLALLAFALPMSTWADEHTSGEGDSGNIGDGGSGDFWDDEQEGTGSNLGSIVPTEVQLAYAVQSNPTGTYGEEGYTPGTVELERLYYSPSGNVGVLSIPHEIQVVNVDVNTLHIDIALYTVVGIGDNAFTGDATITSLTIPYTVKYIGESAFSQCSALISVAVTDPEGETASVLTEIRDGAFSHLLSTSLDEQRISSISLPRSLQTIGEAAFAGNTFTSITLYEGLESIGAEAFERCSLASIAIPSTVKTIGSSAFYRCSNLTTVSMSGATTLGASALGSCTSLTTLVLTDVPETIGGAEDDGDPFAGDGRDNITVYAPTGSAATYVASSWNSLVEADDELHWNFFGTQVTASGLADDEVYYATYYVDEEDYELYDATAYVVSDVNNVGTLTLEDLDGKIPVGTAILIGSSTPADYYFYKPYESSASVATFTANYLYGSKEATTTSVNGTTDGYYFYKFSRDASGTTGSAGFYWDNDDGSAFSIPAYKAWLAVEQTVFTSGIKALSFKHNDDTTGITEVEAVATPAVEGIYTLQGVRVSDMSKKGVYIVNGKKVLVK